MKREYYSRAGNLCISVNPGKWIDAGGSKRRIGIKIAEFQPFTQGTAAGEMAVGQNGAWGHYVTDDKETIKFLDAHIKNLKDQGELPDIVTGEEFGDIITPATSKISALKKEIEGLKRKLSQDNPISGILETQKEQRTQS